jgi:hypothetical protein
MLGFKKGFHAKARIREGREKDFLLPHAWELSVVRSRETNTVSRFLARDCGKSSLCETETMGVFPNAEFAADL